MINTELARTNMLLQQIRAWGVLEDTALATLASVDRARFVPEPYHSFAYADMAIPLGYGQEMLSPGVEAKLLQAVEPKASEHILEVGTGSGYFTALLASEGATVTSVELIPALSESAARILTEYHQVNLVVGNAAYGWASHAPYDAIVVTGALSSVSLQFAAQLKLSGRLVVIVGRDVYAQRALKFVKTEQGLIQTELFTMRAPYLLEGPNVDAFAF